VDDDCAENANCIGNGGFLLAYLSVDTVATVKTQLCKYVKKCIHKCVSMCIAMGSKLMYVAIHTLLYIS